MKIIALLLTFILFASCSESAIEVTEPITRSYEQDTCPSGGIHITIDTTWSDTIRVTF